eukprot:3086412-Alexandrium_andersonii.AAC.1
MPTTEPEAQPPSDGWAEAALSGRRRRAEARSTTGGAGRAHARRGRCAGCRRALGRLVRGGFTRVRLAAL